MFFSCWSQEGEDEEVLSPEEKRQRAQEVTEGHILTQDEFKQVRMRQLATKVAADPRPKGKKRRGMDMALEEDSKRER